MSASLETPATTAPDGSHPRDSVERYTLTLAGRQPEKSWQLASARCSIGSHPSNDITLEEPTVSRFHCEILLDDSGARAVDLKSRNGTFVDGVRVGEGHLRNGSELRLGRASLRYQLSGARVELPVSLRSELGPLVGSSRVMRTAFALLERAAESDATVLIEGETGTGKEGAAEAIHGASARRDKRLVVVDCGALPPNLIESELFGHEKGSFTGASARRVGAFEEADGGTLFLDEMGELPLELQPKLLRVLERKEIRRIGSNAMVPIDVRVIAATHRDLRAAVNQGIFRPDVYFRLAVVRIQLPPLRERLGDIPAIAERLLDQLGTPPNVKAELCSPEFLARLAQATWPGNVRELRNFLHRCVVFRQPLPLDGEAAEGTRDPRGPYAEARRIALESFERRYLQSILSRHQGRVADAAGEAGVNRAYLYRLLRRHGLTP